LKSYSKTIGSIDWGLRCRLDADKVTEVCISVSGECCIKGAGVKELEETINLSSRLMTIKSPQKGG
jgi:hypothetical protein